MPFSKEKWEPLVSVVIAAKNESRHLNACLTSLIPINYPKNKLEIIIVNDASTDNSGDIIDSFQIKLPNMQHIRLAPGEKEKTGKAGALLAGIEKCRGEVIFITDADCRVPCDWIRDTLKGFRKDIGIVGGFTLLDSVDSIFDSMQALDWQFLLSIASAASQINKPITWVGNNLAIRRSAYDKIGGYRHLDNSFVEDFSLIDAVDHKTKWKCRFYASPNSIIRTFPTQTLPQLYAQRKRWSLGIAGARPFGWWIMMTCFATHLLIVISLILSPLHGLLALALKSGIDILIFQKSSRLLNESLRLPRMIFFEVFYVLSSILLPIVLLFDRRVSWKGIKL